MLESNQLQEEHCRVQVHLCPRSLISSPLGSYSEVRGVNTQAQTCLHLQSLAKSEPMTSLCKANGEEDLQGRIHTHSPLPPEQRDQDTKFGVILTSQVCSVLSLFLTRNCVPTLAPQACGALRLTVYPQPPRILGSSKPKVPLWSLSLCL